MNYTHTDSFAGMGIIYNCNMHLLCGIMYKKKGGILCLRFCLERIGSPTETK